MCIILADLLQDFNNLSLKCRLFILKIGLSYFSNFYNELFHFLFLCFSLIAFVPLIPPTFSLSICHFLLMHSLTSFYSSFLYTTSVEMTIKIIFMRLS